MCISAHHLSDDVGDGDEEQRLINSFIWILLAAAATFAYGLRAAGPKEGWNISAAPAARNLQLCPQGSSQEAEGGYCTESALLHHT